MKQSTKCRKTILWFLASALLMAVGCAAPQPQYMTKNQFTLAQASQASQTTGGITVKLEPLDTAKEYKKSYYTQKFRIEYVPFLADTSRVEDIELNVDNYYINTIPFKVTIVNDTDHILRMRDSRVIFVDPDSDEPMMALDKAQIIEDAEVLPAFVGLKEYFVKKYSPINDISESVEKGLHKITKKIKFVNGFNREIMPKMRMTGIIVFNVSPDQASEGKISFVDMVSEVDPAGTPTKKVRFDYRIKPMTKYFRYQPGVDKAWTEISKNDYQG